MEVVRIANPAVCALLAALIALQACSPAPDDSSGTAIRSETLPGAIGSRFPDISNTPDGSLVLSWLEPAGTDDWRLSWSKLESSGWSKPVTVASGADWFINWADFPSVRSLANGLWAAHWLVRSGDSAYAYDVAVSVSSDQGATWSSPVQPHSDSTKTEHGFVSLFGHAPDRVELVWLDGRNSDGDDARLMLMGGALDGSGNAVSENVLDDRVCDCCQTDAARLGNDWLVAYRDRSPDEIRDIRLGLAGPTDWTDLGNPSQDRFEFPACPVNGPAISVGASDVVTFWWLLDERRPVVRAAWSDDGGKTFEHVRDIARGSLPGRVDALMLDDRHAALSWMSRQDEIATIHVEIVDATLSSVRRLDVATVSRSRESGFPRMARDGDEIVVVWTDPDADRIRGARIPL